MQWFSSRKVRLGLLVNGLYLFCVLSPSPPHTRARLYAYTDTSTHESGAEPLRSKTRPGYASLPPMSGPLTAETHYWKSSDQLDVYLSKELLLVRRYDHTLLLSPTYATKVLNPEWPRSVLMQFSSFSHEQHYGSGSPFVITADGAELWRYGTRGPGDATPPNARAPYSVALDGNDQVVETLGHEIPYDIFVQLTRSRQVILELGPDAVQLTPEQLEGLREMHRRLLQYAPSDGRPGVDYVPSSTLRKTR